VEQFNSGGGNGQFGVNFTNRDVGRSVLTQIQQGLTNANQWLANTRQNLTAPLFNPANMFISPAEQIQVTSANNAGQYNSQFLQNQLKAAQAPASIVGQGGAGLNQFGQSLGSLGSIGGTGGGGTAGEFGVSSTVGSTPPQSSGGYGGGGNFGNGYGNWWGTPSP